MEEKNLMATPTQLRREKVHAQICAEFTILCNEYPTTPKWRIFSTLGRRHEYTAQGIYRIVKSKGLMK